MATVREAQLLQIINRVLVEVSQGHNVVAGNASSLTDRYHIKVAQWVNDILEEVEDSAVWRVLITRATATVSANALSAALSTSTPKSRLLRVHEAHHEMLVPLIFDVTSGSAQLRLQELDLAEILRRDQENSNASSGTSPSHFAMDPTPTGLDVVVWPRPTANVSIEADITLPQARLETDSNAKLITVINVPALPVVLGATWRALLDKGEELEGQTASGAERLYRNELSAAVSMEVSDQGANELVAV